METFIASGVGQHDQYRHCRDSKSFLGVKSEIPTKVKIIITMIEEVLSWIDKNVKDVSGDNLFQKYFNIESIIKIEKNFYLSNKLQGIGIVMSQNLVITSINFFSGKYEDSQIFKEKLPLNLNFSLNSEDVHSLFGKPNKSGGGQKNIYLGYVPYWDKYYTDKYSFHIQYSQDKSSIDMLTIVSLKLEEYFNSEMQ